MSVILKDVESIAEQAMDLITRAREKYIPELVAGPAPGTHRLDYRQELTAVANLLKKYPEKQYQLPDGSTIMGSGWLLALPLVEGGRDELRRIERAFVATLGRAVGFGEEGV